MKKYIERCENCRFGTFFGLEGGGSMTNCRHNAPTKHPTTIDGVFPVMEDTDWCGKYRESKEHWDKRLMGEEA